MIEKIGIDFDNTIINYDSVFHQVALERGLISSKTPANKKIIRDHIRTLPDGEMTWQRLQPDVYTDAIIRGKLQDETIEFFNRCQSLGIETYIVSHKTEISKMDPQKRNLRNAALGWMESSGLIPKTGLTRDRIFFMEDRTKKASQVASLGCDYFIDDLAETFSEPCFPKQTKKILFSPSSEIPTSSDLIVLSSWEAVLAYFFYDGKGLLNASRVTRLGAGLNSRVYQVGLDGSDYALKFYQKEDVKLPRIKREYFSLRFLSDVSSTPQTPEAISMDLNLGCALYELIVGDPVKKVGEEDVIDLVKFLGQLKDLAEVYPKKFEPAKEAVFSPFEIEQSIRKRLTRLNEAKLIYPELANYLDNELAPGFEKILESAKVLLKKENQEWDGSFLECLHILSASDIGFHNAIRKKDGKMVYLDFEHFGLDTAIKLCADFLLHPGMNLDSHHRKNFTKQIFALFNEDPDLAKKVEALLPLFAIKWCLIFLNEFIPSDLERRKLVMAFDAEDSKCMQNSQLIKSRKLLQETLSARYPPML